MRAGNLAGSAPNRRSHSQVRRLGKRPFSVSRARSRCISGVGCSSTLSNRWTVGRSRTIMMTKAFRNTRSE